MSSEPLIHWESVSEFEQRARVHGGWLVLSFLPGPGEGRNQSIAMAFVPDPEHEWGADGS